MADFTSDFQSFKPPFPFFDNIDPNMEAVMNQFAVLHPSLMEASSMNLHSFVGFSNENFFNPQQQQQHVAEFPGNLLENFPGIFHHDEKNVILLPQAPISPAALSTGNGNCFNTDSKKRKLMELSESTSGNSSHISEIGIERKNSSGKGKKIKANQKEQGLPKEVVHVRARRGQATDSHSLAERVRRGKINERLRCLQDIVPGCYKTMGMAVMLDEIINYVQSLQNQVEFLSMKLTAASTFYDFNSDTEAIEALQKAKANEAQKVQRVMREGYEEEVGSTQLGPLDLTFGTYPSLPYTTSG